jgi:hypothetical protein
MRASYAALIATLAATASAQYNSDVLLMNANNWKDMLDSPHGYFINVCRQG